MGRKQNFFNHFSQISSEIISHSNQFIGYKLKRTEKKELHKFQWAAPTTKLSIIHRNFPLIFNLYSP